MEVKENEIASSVRDNLVRWSKRGKGDVEIGFLPMAGSINKSTSFDNGYPVSSLNIQLYNVRPQDVPYIIELIQAEAARLSEDDKETERWLKSK